VELQLAIGKRGLGIELSHPAKVGPLAVTELSLTLPAVRFPIDVSGGVRRFRHRRGTLERLTLELGEKELAREWAPRLAGLLSRGAPLVSATPRRHGASVAIVDPESERVLAFDVALLTEGGDLLVVPFAARGLALPRPALELAVRALDALLTIAGKNVTERRGAVLRLRGVYARVARAILPEAGARAPSADDVKTAALTPANEAWVLQGFRDAVEPEHAPEAVGALELAEQVADADDAMLAGDADRARVLGLHALSRLPLHPEVCARVADLDRLVPGREEAARSTLEHATATPTTLLLGAELAEHAGDANAARIAFERAAEAEPHALVAAFALARAAALTGSALDAAALLDAAVVRVPHHPGLRERRVRTRLALGRLRDALADVEELEALARGHRARHAVWMRAARAWTEAGHAAEARALFERALRFAPDEPNALAGLGAAMLASGQRARGLQLLTRAFSFEGQKPPPAPYRLALAEALADVAADPATAVARLDEIVDGEDEAPLARGLEGRLRRELGDVAGASLAYARLRDLVLARPVVERYRARVAELLGEAVTFEERTRRDALLADSHRRALAHAFPNAPRTIPPAAPPAFDAGAAEGPNDEVAAERLIARYRENPDDHAVVEALAAVLSRLGRSHELLALLSARLEEAPTAVRVRLAPLHRDVLAGLERDARARGHDHEAQLFRDALVALGGTIEP
jgi:tetratricopeptide (TPR) repeat protein